MSAVNETLIRDVVAEVLGKLGGTATTNGMLLGVIGAACAQYGMAIPLWSFVAPHGSLELPAIIISGAAGFRIGHAMLFPGALRWKESLAQGGIEATRLISGTIPMLVIAGCLEGFFSPSHAPIALKFTVGGLIFTMLNLWLFQKIKIRPGSTEALLPPGTTSLPFHS